MPLLDELLVLTNKPWLMSMLLRYTCGTWCEGAYLVVLSSCVPWLAWRQGFALVPVLI